MDAGPGAAPHPARGRPGAPSSATRAPGAPWARFSAWLECVCVVTFDLELGQALELVYPSDSRLTDKEVGPALWERTSPGEQALTRFPVFQKSSICYLSFPDSHSGCLGDTQFSFRIRQCGGQRHLWHPDDRHCDSGVPVSLQREPAHYFGYVYFRQVKDSSVKRGYFQKSLVLVSRLPFVRLFQALLSLIAPEYFDKLVPCLEAVCSEIDQWPDPMPGQTLNLPVMGVVLQVHIPSRADKPESSPPKQCGHENLLPAPVVLSSVHELDLFRCFQPVLAHVQMLWELMLLGEPLVVLAPSPAVSSEMVLALTSCLQPLKFCCDYRPYFTVHDSEFKEFTTRTQAPPNVVLGVTNPFFIKTLQHWPHILRIGEPRMSGDLPKQVKLKKPSRLKTLDTKPGLYTAYTAHLHRDKALLRRLLKGLQRERPSDLLSALLRRHLLELTQSFIIPLEHYMASLMPLQKSITPWKVLSRTPPQIRPFRQDDFLRSLEHSGPQLTCMLKGDWLGLYRRFFKSPHFDGWYRQRHKEMAQKLEALHLEAICEAQNIEIWMKDKSEVEVVDLVLKLRERLVRAQGHQLPVKEATLKRARLYIETVVRSLPTDLQVVLCSP
ncbi:protein DENND6B isoform X1 [Camelus ferus]|uniref:Protein DENND6B isoform X1 n=2 Tax=Camelus TaxID=9836 RepID=A0A8B8U1N6_CAMFR|nr:protein DENND6B isoform X1 [Camelus ferus]XP_045374288.1 protein DENND6B isoform X1 [Camelus bactrianus]